MYASPVREAIRGLKAYVPGLSIAEIQEKYGLSQVIKLASNENPLGTPPLAQQALRDAAATAFRYPQGGNPRLVKALARRHGVSEARVVVGNGSDEILDLLIRLLLTPGRHSMVCFAPCFSIYPIQGQVCGVEVRRQPLRQDFSHDYAALAGLVDESTRLVFVTTPDNPSGYCPPRAEVEALAAHLAKAAPDCLLVVDEAYMDFVGDDDAAEAQYSLLAGGCLPDNVAVVRTFSKVWGLAGMRVGYAVLPEALAGYCWRARLPFSVNILAEEAALAALEDTVFHEETLRVTRLGRVQLRQGMEELGCTVWPSAANFLMFQLPGGKDAGACVDVLLRRGIIIRALKSYDLPQHLRVSVGTEEENAVFLAALGDFLQGKQA